MPEHTRRRLLAATGTAAAASLAGCSALPFGDDPTVSGGDLAAVVAEPAPSVPASLPVAMASDHLAETETAIRDDLASVPASVDAAAAPNGAIRDRLTRERDRATEALARATEAQSPWERAGRVRRARSAVGFLVGAWAAIDGDRSVAAVRRDADAVRADLAAFRRTWAYVGADPVDAVVVHDAIAGLVRGCLADLNRVLSATPSDPTAALTVAETDEHLAGARVALRDAAHLFDRLDRGDGVRDRRDTFASAAAALVEQVRTRRRDLGLADGTPTSGVPEGAVPAERALHERERDARRGARIEEFRATGAFPRAVVEAHRELALLGAVETLRARVDAGEAVDPASADDLRTIRRRAREAVATSAADGRTRPLDRLRLHDLAAAIAYYDDDLSRYDADRQVSIPGLGWELAGYVSVAAVARNVVPASDAVAAALTGSGA
ncbi:hypothetical protein [Halobaculum lipolyticum]|uniref:HTH Mu-type domain-containing protein n=1 Tax=Halobaculum lipolyticum TaxID=3032001 RepID=A0ABD5WFL3_9EURY|nr:hypothetical protein [Halobaculum sp. DT31]